MPVAAAIAAAGALTAGASIISGNKAAKAAKHAANSNNALQADIYNQNKATLAPYVDRGNAAGANINALLGMGGDAGAAHKAFDTFTGSDGYQFRLGQGERALNTGYAARGLLQSGAAAKALQTYGQNTASDEFGKYLGYLGGQQQTGLGAASAQAGVGQNYAGAVGANNNSAASAAGNAALNTGAQIGNFAGNALNALALTKGLSSSYGASGTPPIYGGSLGGIY
jgi:hypothetical protein